MTKTTRTPRAPRAPRQCEIASDEGYNLAGRPVLLAKLTAYISRPVFAQLAQVATAAGGEYSRHNQAFQFTDPAARESFAAQARVILTNTATNHAKAEAHDRAAMREDAKHPRSELEKLQDLLTNQEETLADWTDDTAIATPSEIDELKSLILKTREAIANATPRAPTLADRIAARYPGIASHVEIVRPVAYTDTPTTENPPAIRVSTSRPIRSTMTDRTPAGYGPTQPQLF